MIQKMCGVKITDRKNTSELMEIKVGLGRNCCGSGKEKWFEMDGPHVEEGDEEPGKRAWDLKVDGIRGKGRPKITWKDMVYVCVCTCVV